MSNAISKEKSDGAVRTKTSKLRDPEFRNTPITPDRYFSKEWADKEWDKIWTKTWQIGGVAAVSEIAITYCLPSTMSASIAACRWSPANRAMPAASA